MSFIKSYVISVAFAHSTGGTYLCCIFQISVTAISRHPWDNISSRLMFKIIIKNYIDYIVIQQGMLLCYIFTMNNLEAAKFCCSKNAPNLIYEVF